MAITDSQVFLALILALFPGFMALRLAAALYK